MQNAVATIGNLGPDAAKEIPRFRIYAPGPHASEREHSGQILALSLLDAWDRLRQKNKEDLEPVAHILKEIFNIGGGNNPVRIILDYCLSPSMDIMR